MERLSLVDQALYKIGATGLSAMNMQGASIFDPKAAPFKVDAKILAEHLAARLQEVPILRKRLVQDPLLLGDVWMVDDPDFDVWHHITFATLPPPGDLKTLTRHLGRFSAEELNPNRPLWRFEIIDGLKGGRLAIAQKLSHAIMDGMAAARVMQCINDTKPRRPSRYTPLQWSPEPLPSKRRLVGSAVLETADRVVFKPPRVAAKLLRLSTWTLVKSAGRRLSGDTDSTGEQNAPKMPQAHLTSLNGKLSPDKRNIIHAVFALDELKALGLSMHCTLNDLCLLMVSQALIAYFDGIGERIDFDLACAMPLSTRSTSDRTYGNALSIAMIDLHSTVGDLEERLRLIRRETILAKDSIRGDNKIDLSIISDVASMIPPLTLDILFHALKRLAPWDKLPLPSNAVFTNVPGPPEDLYVAGMPVESPIPIIPMVPPGALSIGGVSSGNHFSFGFHACGRMVKEENMSYFVDGLESAHRQLMRRHQPTRSKKKANPTSKPKPKTKPRGRTLAA